MHLRDFSKAVQLREFSNFLNTCVSFPWRYRISIQYLQRYGPLISLMWLSSRMFNSLRKGFYTVYLPSLLSIPLCVLSLQ